MIRFSVRQLHANAYPRMLSLSSFATMCQSYTDARFSVGLPTPIANVSKLVEHQESGMSYMLSTTDNQCSGRRRANLADRFQLKRKQRYG